ncbi:hypothetical protein EI94DRAFT_1890021 [Lactarius quietus]|nr:hypothetical protein EI94DRAFT_1890021 [Lactarius quietus]
MHRKKTEQEALEAGIQGLTLESGSSHTNSPAVTSQYLTSASASTSHASSPATADVPTHFHDIEPSLPTSVALSPGPSTVAAAKPSAVTAAEHSTVAATKCSTVTAAKCSTVTAAECLTVTAAEHSKVASAKPAAAAIPHLVRHTVRPEQQYVPPILLPPQDNLRWLRSIPQTSEATGGFDGGLEGRIQVLERWRVEDEEWKTVDREWKRQLEERLIRIEEMLDRAGL